MDFYTYVAIHAKIPISETREDNVELHFKLCSHGSTLMIDLLVSNWYEIEVHGHCIRKEKAKSLTVVLHIG